MNLRGQAVSRIPGAKGQMDMSIGANFNGRERRRHLRLRLEVSGRLEARPQTPVACEIYNISVGGALLESRLRLRLG